MIKEKTHYRFIGLVLLLVLLGSINTLTGQEGAPASTNEADFFDESQFDASVKADLQKEKENRLEYLAGGNLIFSASMMTLADYTAYYGAGHLYGKAFLKINLPDTGMFFLSYSLSHYLFQGTNADDPIIRNQGADLFALNLTLSELYLAFDLGKLVFMRLGNQLMAWGPAFFWTPEDFINLQKKNAYESVDLRAGVPALKIHIPLATSANLYFITDFSRTIDNASVIQDMFRQTNLAFRCDATLAGWEFGISGFGGATTNWRYGADLTGNLFGIDVYTEAGLTMPFKPEAINLGVATGLQKHLGDEKEWSLQSEFFYNSTGYAGKVDYLSLAPGDFNPFYMGKYYLFAAVSRDKLFDGYFSVSLACVANLSDLSYNPRLTLSWDLPAVMPFKLILSYSGGGADKEFTFVNGDNAMGINLETALVF